MKIDKRIVVALLAFWFASAYAAPFAGESVIDTINRAMEGASGKIASTALVWLGAFATLQLVVTNFGLIKSGADIEAVLGKFIGSVAWIGFCVYVLTNGAEFIEVVGNGLFNLLGGELLSASDILLKALATALKMLGIVIVSAAVPMIGNTVGPLFTYVLIFFLAVSVLFAFKIFMVQLELGLIIMLAPLSFSFLGLNALKDQGIAPFKALISLAYRIILMLVIMQAFNGIDEIIGSAIEVYSKLGSHEQLYRDNIATLASGIFSGLVAYMLLAYLLFKSDSIAATLSSGSTSMGSGEIASAAAMGAAVGAAVASGGASAAGGASKASELMSDVVGRMSSSVSDASSKGSGGQAGGTETSRPGATASLSSNSNSAAPAFPTNSKGAPIRPAAPASKFGGDSEGKESSVESTPVSEIGGQASSAAPASPSEPSASGVTAGAGGSGGGSAPISASGGPSSSEAPASPPEPSASGATAGIGGGGDAVEKSIERLSEQMQKQSQSKKPTFGENFGQLNQHVARETAGTHVSINANAAD